MSTIKVRVSGEDREGRIPARRNGPGGPARRGAHSRRALRRPGRLRQVRRDAGHGLRRLRARPGLPDPLRGRHRRHHSSAGGRRRRGHNVLRRNGRGWPRPERLRRRRGPRHDHARRAHNRPLHGRGARPLRRLERPAALRRGRDKPYKIRLHPGGAGDA